MEDPTLDAKAEKYKNMGNDEFKKQNYQAAINYYSEAIDIKENEPAFFTNRAIAYLKIEKFEEARRDCQMALDINPKFAKAYNRLSKCHIAFGNLYDASIALQKSIELDPTNATNKNDQKHLADLKIVDSLVKKAIAEEMYEKAVTNLNALLLDCSMSIDRICLKIECLCKSFQFEEANKYSADLMKKTELADKP